MHLTAAEVKPKKEMQFPGYSLLQLPGEKMFLFPGKIEDHSQYT
jgi:hypothetical protein